MVPDHGSYLGVNLPTVFDALRLQVALSGRSVFLVEDIRNKDALPLVASHPSSQSDGTQNTFRKAQEDPGQ